MKTVAIIQARMASSRLPGKVLVDLGGNPALSSTVTRTAMAETIDQVVVATTQDSSDDPIASLCLERGYAVFRGSQHDVLDRYYQASRAFQADIIVRITADCPLIDPGVIDKTVNAFLSLDQPSVSVSNHSSTRVEGPTVDSPTVEGPNREQVLQWDFAANRLPPPWGRTYPIGLDTEVTTTKNLSVAWQEATLPHQREHVMPFFYEQPERFRILLVDHPTDYGSLRWTLDTPEDLILLRLIFSHFAGQKDFSWLDVLDYVQTNPDLVRLNAEVHHKDYRDYDHRRTA